MSRAATNVVPYSRFLSKQIKRKALSVLPQPSDTPTLRIDLTDWANEMQKGIRQLEKLLAENEQEEQQHG
jgi:hypothetical protein